MKEVRITEVGGIFLAKSLIITEKPSVAQEFARILGVSGRNDGYIENSDYVITWCVGHLVEMVYPEVYDEKYKKWKLEDLPFLPKEYKYDVIPAVSKQYDVVHKMLHREDIDTVYWAGDAGKEGQTIEENIRMDRFPDRGGNQAGYPRSKADVGLCKPRKIRHYEDH